MASEALTLAPACPEAFHARFGSITVSAMLTFWNKSNLIFHARAKAFHAAGRLDPALRDLTEAVRVAPQNRELHKILLSLKLEIKDKAEKCFEIKENPKILHV